MSTPVMEIELDPGPWTEEPWVDYHLAGGVVSGRLRVQTEEALNCRGVVISIGWHTEGRGDMDSETIFEQTVHHGGLPAGEHVFPFSIRLPASPMSYAGHYVKIVWAVQARIDVAWKVNPRVQRVFFVTLPWDEGEAPGTGNSG